MAAKINTATLNLKDMQFIMEMRQHSGYDYAKCMEVIGQQVMKGLDLDGEMPMTEFLLSEGKGCKIIIQHNGTGLFDL